MTVKLKDVVESTKLSSSAIVVTGKCNLAAMLLGTDGVNDPVVTVYDGTDNTGEEVVPTTTYDASALGLSGYMGKLLLCDTGIYVEITCAGTVEVVIHYNHYAV